MIGHTSIGLADIVFHYIFESKDKNMVDRFGLQGMKLNKNDTNLFFIYDIDYHSNPNRYQLKVEEIKSSTIENLMKAFRGADLPEIDDFIKVLHKKLRLNLGVKI